MFACVITCCVLMFYCTSVLAAIGTKLHTTNMLWLPCSLIICCLRFKYLEVGNECKQGLAKDELPNAACC